MVIMVINNGYNDDCGTNRSSEWLTLLSKELDRTPIQVAGESLNPRIEIRKTKYQASSSH